MSEQHTILGGKVHVYKRPNSSLWQCSSYFAGKNRRTSTQEERLAEAKEIAEDWYLQLRGKLRTGEIKTEKTFRGASEQYLREYDIITQEQRSKIYVKGQHNRSRVHLVPFFGSTGLSDITAGKIQEYRIHRYEEAVAKRGKPPAYNTMHQEIVALRQSLNTAIRHGWLDHFSISPNRTGHHRKSRTALGSPSRNTNSSTRPQEDAHTSRSRRASNGNRNNFMTTFCSRPTRACGPTKRGVFSSGTRQSLTTRAVRRSLRSRCAANAVLAIARV